MHNNQFKRPTSAAAPTVALRLWSAEFNRYVMKINILLIAIILSGCAPIPHTKKLTPDFTGVVTINDYPTNNIEVRLASTSRDTGCDEPSMIARTDKNGLFTIKGATQFEWFVGLMGDRFYTWNICISHGGKIYSGKYDGTTGHLPEHVSLTCNIRTNSVPYISSMTGTELDRIQVCE